MIVNTKKLEEMAYRDLLDGNNEAFIQDYTSENERLYLEQVDAIRARCKIKVDKVYTRRKKLQPKLQEPEKDEGISYNL